MVRVNFRKNYGVEESRIFQFFKDLGYEHIGSNNKSIMVEDKIIPTEVFVRKTKVGRHHLHLAFGYKYSGNEKYPQIKVFAHFDVIKVIHGREKYFADRREKRDIKEIYKIGKKLKEESLGFLEEKDQKCAHGTLEMKCNDKLMEYIAKRKYKKYEKGKYRKELLDSQYTLSLFSQEKFIHVVCVYAKVIGYRHVLDKRIAGTELNRIIKYVN
ncbi:hypothetical protein LCGC14_0775030 [marine sediment metagenome]|uniref:Uncharacterized protein n=1 Tax=marine sediment metagenome TaxID=412755 RepID=A0A0F9PXH0_9ZZZZ